MCQIQNIWIFQVLWGTLIHFYVQDKFLFTWNSHLFNIFYKRMIATPKIQQTQAFLHSNCRFSIVQFSSFRQPKRSLNPDQVLKTVESIQCENETLLKAHAKQHAQKIGPLLKSRECRVAEWIKIFFTVNSKLIYVVGYCFNPCWAAFFAFTSSTNS